ncbi:A1 family peptidase [Phanerochaete sordida]|uniref:A1 family peptidase n=1 Tax=Phanerochaete sordida TaxID=48140 RepID=A0A9P3GEF1_9APHY|nr:A1 family peptidase [Phanerochaete sordida]
MLFHTLLSLAVVLAATASPLVVRSGPITLPLARHLNLTGGSARMLQNDQARARAFKAGSFAQDAAVPVPVTGNAVSYLAEVNIGKSTTPYSLIVDTGSSNTWVGAQGRDWSAGGCTDELMEISYGSGSFVGNYCQDTVTIGGAGGLQIKNQGIGNAALTEGFSDVDGILGIGPTGLTSGTTLNHSTIPTVTDNAFDQDLISSPEVGVLFTPSTSTSSTDGELTFGGVDSSALIGSVSYVPITKTSPASKYWGIDQSITYGSGSESSTILASTAGIVDTGTTLVLIASDAFQKYQTATGGVKDSNTGLLSITSDQYARLQSLFFSTSGGVFELTPNAQIWPRSLNTAIGGAANGIYLIVGDLESNSGEGLDFINGMKFLERYYSVYDTQGERVGLSSTEYTFATSN